MTTLEALQQQADELWDRTYDFDGFALADYLNDFFGFDECRASQHGERVYLRLDDGHTAEIFDRFDQWREGVSYYHMGFTEIAGDLDLDDFEDRVIIFTYKLCSVLGILDRVSRIAGIEPTPPEHADSFLFM